MGSAIRWAWGLVVLGAAAGAAAPQVAGESARRPGEPAPLAQTVTLNSPGGYASAPLPPNTLDVHLVQIHGGACRARETWGFDLALGSVWVDGGCSATFRIDLRAPVPLPAPVPGRPQPPLPAHPAPPVYPPPGYPPPVYPPPVYPPAGPAVPAGQARPIRGPGNLCLDIRGAARVGAPAIAFPCHGRGNQRFAWTAQSELMVDGLCLDVANSERRDGAAVIAWTCNGGLNQQWFIDRDLIRSRLNGKCLTIWGPLRAETPVALSDCRGRIDQQWRW